MKTKRWHAMWSVTVVAVGFGFVAPATAQVKEPNVLVIIGRLTNAQNV